MKRLLTISLLLIYLIFSMGIVISYHYCGGSLGEVSLFKKAKNCCPDANTEKSCCQNSVAFYKITSDYNSDITPLEAPQVGFIALIQPVFSHSILIPSSGQSDQIFDLHRLKHVGKQPVYLTNRVFIL